MPRKTTNTSRSHTSARGFSLVELMVAMILGLVLTGATSALFLNSKRAFSENEYVGGMYEYGNYALSEVADALRTSGFFGKTQSYVIKQSATLAVITNDCSGNAAGYDLTNPLWAVTAASNTVATCITDAKPNSDVIFVKHVASAPTAPSDLDASKTYLASNETTGQLFDGADTPPTTTSGGDVPGGQFWEYMATAYYVADEEPPVLYRRRLTGNTWAAREEVALGIENLRVELGVDSDQDGVPNFFADAATADWENVVSARLFLLVRSEFADPYYKDTRIYTLGGRTIYPADGDSFHRLVISTDVTVRNRRLMLAGGL